MIDWLLALALCLVAFSSLLLLQQVNRQQRRLAELEESLASLQERHAEEYRLSIEAAYGVGRRLTDTEKRLRETTERQAQIENLQTADTASRGAQRIRQIATPSRESLTRNEAKLAALIRNDASDSDR